MNINKYIEDLKEFIGIELEVKGGNKEGDTIIVPYVVTPKKVSILSLNFAESTFIDKDYVENMKSLNAYEDLFDNYTLNELKTYLTFIIRTDRFSEGFLMKKIKDGTVNKILQSIKNSIKS